jgi:hypothetical protein
MPDEADIFAVYRFLRGQPDQTGPTGSAAFALPSRTDYNRLRIYVLLWLSRHAPH